MQLVTSGGISLFYVERGAGRPVLFVHGIPTDYRVWSSQIEAFSPTFRGISYSRRHANPNKNDGKITESTVQNNSDDLVSLIKELKLEHVHLVGHSYGGFISIYSAWKHPEMFASLVLVEPAIPSLLVKNERNPIQVLAFLLSNPSAASSARRFQSKSLKHCLQAFDAGDYSRAASFFIDGIYERTGAMKDLPSLIQSIVPDNAKTVGELETDFPIFSKQDAREISLPTLLVKGRKSPAWLRAIVDRLSKTLPNSSLVEIPNSGHVPHVENPLEFNSKVLEFLKRQ